MTAHGACPDRRFLDLNERVRFEFDGPWIAVTWLDVHVRQATTPERGDPCTTCCVTCGGDDYCGCRVITPCGNCCCPATRSCIITTASTADPRVRPGTPEACCVAGVKWR